MMIDRRTVLKGAAAGGAVLMLPRWARAAAASDLKPVQTQIDRQREQALERLQQWIRQPSVSAENIGVQKCCDLTLAMLRDAGFQAARRIETDGHPGIFATYDAGAKRTLG